VHLHFIDHFVNKLLVEQEIAASTHQGALLGGCYSNTGECFCSLAPPTVDVGM